MTKVQSATALARRWTGTISKISLVMGPVQSYCRAWLSGNAAQGGLPSPTTYRAELADAAWRSVKA